MVAGRFVQSIQNIWIFSVKDVISFVFTNLLYGEEQEESNACHMNTK